MSAEKYIPQVSPYAVAPLPAPSPGQGAVVLRDSRDVQSNLKRHHLHRHQRSVMQPRLSGHWCLLRLELCQPISSAFHTHYFSFQASRYSQTYCPLISLRTFCIRYCLGTIVFFVLHFPALREGHEAKVTFFFFISCSRRFACV